MHRFDAWSLTIETWCGMSCDVKSDFLSQVQPCVGIWSDKCTSKYGRRRPFILAGALMISVAVRACDFTFVICISLFVYYCLPTQLKPCTLGHNNRLFCRHWIFVRRHQRALQVITPFLFVRLIFTHNFFLFTYYYWQHFQRYSNQSNFCICCWFLDVGSC